MQVMPDGQPGLAALGSQSCVPLPQDAVQLATFVPLSRQQTVEVGQSAAEAHCTPVAFGSEHVLPVSQVGVLPFCG
jgi:hypothetical protein